MKITILQISNQQTVDQTRHNGGEVVEEHVSLQVVVTKRGIRAMVASVRLFAARGEAMLPGAPLVSRQGLEWVMALQNGRWLFMCSAKAPLLEV